MKIFAAGCGYTTNSKEAELDLSQKVGVKNRLLSFYLIKERLQKENFELYCCEEL